MTELSPTAAPPEAASPTARARAPFEDRLFPFVFAALAVAALVPIWRVRFLPLLDHPNHLSSIYVLHSFNDPAARLREFYELNIQPIPYAGYYFLVHIVAFAAGIEAANQIVLSAYVLSLPVAALLWARRTRRSDWLSVLTFPLAYSYSWSYGFHPFNVAIGSFLFGVVAVDLYFERASAWRALAVSGLALFCALGHPLALMSLYLCSPLLAVACRARLREAAAVAALLVPSAALFTWQVARAQSGVGAIAKKGGWVIEGAHLPVTEMLRALPTYTLDSVAGDADLWVFAVIAGSFALLFVSGLLARRAGASDARSWLSSNRGALLCGAMLVCYLVIPLHLAKPFDWWFVSGRFAPLVCFFAFLLPAGRIRGARLALLAPAALAALYLPLLIAGRYVAFNEQAAPFVRMVEETRPGANVLFLSMKPRGDPGLNVDAYNQFAAWVQILRGGFSGSGWFYQQYTFKVKKYLPTPPWYSNEQFSPAAHAGPYQYIIVHNESATRPIFPPSERDFRLVRREGSFSFYARASEPVAP